jgi:AcrR family transcriptional regulator
MVRWEPGTAARLQKAALDLFATRGFEQTTATEIAQSVGLTERTFFRHFSDKRDVLFHGQELLVRAFLDGVESAPPDAAAIEIVAAALHSAATFFPDERRHKLAILATTVAQALRDRGVDDLSATLASESGATVFAIAFAQWIREGENRSFADIEADILRGLLTLTGAARFLSEGV